MKIIIIENYLEDVVGICDNVFDMLKILIQDIEIELYDYQDSCHHSTYEYTVEIEYEELDDIDKFPMFAQITVYFTYFYLENGIEIERDCSDYYTLSIGELNKYTKGVIDDD